MTESCSYLAKCTRNVVASVDDKHFLALCGIHRVDNRAGDPRGFIEFVIFHMS